MRTRTIEEFNDILKVWTTPPGDHPVVVSVGASRESVQSLRDAPQRAIKVFREAVQENEFQHVALIDNGRVLAIWHAQTDATSGELGSSEKIPNSLEAVFSVGDKVRLKKDAPYTYGGVFRQYRDTGAVAVITDDFPHSEFDFAISFDGDEYMVLVDEIEHTDAGRAEIAPEPVAVVIKVGDLVMIKPDATASAVGVKALERARDNREIGVVKEIMGDGDPDYIRVEFDGRDFWRFMPEELEHASIDALSSDAPDQPKWKRRLTNQEMTVTIPAMTNHGDYPTHNTVTVRLLRYCPECGAERSTPRKSFSYDGSRRIEVDTWEDGCGHYRGYGGHRTEASWNGLNPGYNGQGGYNFEEAMAIREEAAAKPALDTSEQKRVDLASMPKHGTAEYWKAQYETACEAIYNIVQRSGCYDAQNVIDTVNQQRQVLRHIQSALQVAQPLSDLVDEIAGIVAATMAEKVEEDTLLNSMLNGAEG